MLMRPYSKNMMSWPSCTEDGCGDNLWKMVRLQNTGMHAGGGRDTCICNCAETLLARNATSSFLKAAIDVSVGSEEEIWNYIILF